MHSGCLNIRFHLADNNREGNHPAPGKPCRQTVTGKGRLWFSEKMEEKIMDTNAITNAYTAQAQSAAESASASKAKNTSKVAKPAGQKEVGKPQLSEKAQKY